MNYIRLLRAYEQWTEQHYLSGNAELLWYKLVSLWNKNGWETWIQTENRQLMGLLRMKNEMSFIRSRKELVEAGLLEYEKGRKGHPGRYRMLLGQFHGLEEPEAIHAECTDKTQVQIQAPSECTDKMQEKNEYPPKYTCKMSVKEENPTICPYKMKADLGKTAEYTCKMQAETDDPAACTYKMQGESPKMAENTYNLQDIYKHNPLSKNIKERENIINYNIYKAPKVQGELTKAEYDQLVKSYGQDLVDRKRRNASGYAGCDTYSTLKRWCEEDLQKKQARYSQNRFNNFEQREYDFDEYEKMLLMQN